MKQKVSIRRRDGIKQRYTVGKTPRPIAYKIHTKKKATDKITNFGASPNRTYGESTIEELEQDIKEYETEIDEYEDKITDFEAKINKLKSVIKTNEDSLNRKRKQLEEELAKELSYEQKPIDDLRDEIEAEQENIDTYKKFIESNKSRIDIAKYIIEKKKKTQ